MQDFLIYNTITDFVRPDAFHKDYHIHLLCKGGKMSFFCGHKLFEVTAGEFLIWQMTTGFADISYSEDFDAPNQSVFGLYLSQHCRYPPSLMHNA